MIDTVTVSKNSVREQKKPDSLLVLILKQSDEFVI